MFKLIALPATFGDCLWIQYGDPQDPQHVLVDGGTGGTRRHLRAALDRLPADRRHFELVVVSHIDNDHIAGVLRLLEEEGQAPQEERLGLRIDDLWFNGWPQLNGIGLQAGLPEHELFGVEQGERLTDQIRQHDLPWNAAFGGAAAVVPEDGELPSRTLPGGLTITLLSPLKPALEKLRDEWRDYLLENGLLLEMEDFDRPQTPEVESFGTPSTGILDIDALAASEFEPDGSDANRSSIAFVAEFEGKRLLMAADAHADVLLAGLQRLQPGQPARLDLLKISHHGAEGTTSRPLIEALDCPRYLFSTNGSNYFHPHAESVSRVIVGSARPPELIFNYLSERNRAWGELAALNPGHPFRTRYPQAGQEGIVVEL